LSIVLLGAAGTGTSFAIASRLRSSWGNHIRLVLTDIYDECLVTTSLLGDKFFKVPCASDPSFELAIVNILLHENINTYIPILNDEIILGAKLSQDDRFRHIDIWSSDTHAACTDKKFADGWLRSIGVRTPKMISAEQAISDNHTWFSKPRSGLGSRAARPITSHQVVELRREELSELIIQEKCEGPEVTIDSFWDSSTNSGYAYCRERIEVKAGVCTKARLFYEPELAECATKIGVALKQRGAICFQAMRSHDSWVVTDLNLRPGAGTAMTCAAGYDVLSAAFACRSGEDYSRFVRPMGVEEQVYITRQYSEFVMQHTL
jgi:carbamoylphosphate synthase large subunit